MLEHERRVYGILDALGDFGGVEFLLETIAAFLVAPFAAHNFLIYAISRLYKAKSTENNLFKQRSNKINEPEK